MQQLPPLIFARTHGTAADGLAWPGRPAARSPSLFHWVGLYMRACMRVYLSESAQLHKAKILPLFLACVWVNVCICTTYVCVCCFLCLASFCNDTYGSVRVCVCVCTHTHVQTSAYLRLYVCCMWMFVLPLKAKYSRRRAPLMVKTCKRHTHTYIYKYTCIRVRVCICACCLGANLNLTASPSAFAALGNKFR